MYTGRSYKTLTFLQWTILGILCALTWSTAITLLYETFEYKEITVPWLPIALLGTAVAFIISFKNNTSYSPPDCGKHVKPGVQSLTTAAAGAL